MTAPRPVVEKLAARLVEINSERLEAVVRARLLREPMVPGQGATRTPPTS